MDKQYREKMGQVKIERKGKIPYPEKINTSRPPGWCLHSTFAYEDVLDLKKMYRGKGCVENFIGQIEDKVQCNISTATHDRVY